MQAAYLPIRYGWAWSLQGWALFKRQPMAMLFWSLMTSLLINLNYLIPIIGQIALITITPALGFIALNACLHLERNEPMQLGMWLAPLRNPRIKSALLRLGFTYLLFCIIAGFISVLPFVSDIMLAADSLNAEQMLAAIRTPFILFGVFYLGIAVLFWHAPALMSWYDIPLKQSLFYSMVACWRNKWALIIFGVFWAAVYVAIQYLTSVMASVFSPDIAYFLATPLNLFMMAVLYSSFYPIFRSIFGLNNPPPNLG